MKAQGGLTLFEIAAAALGLALAGALLGTVAWVIVHFVEKYW